ncbi:hypothetical protein [Ornithinimicrobium murale]|uniref:hypothetical protein n=1 Tax=Ornithinimicrobium murale TaxID=1050153 RepID=UPI000E0D7933|nr:hypothetical protein [Ornithinimicrobium murale]
MSDLREFLDRGVAGATDVNLVQGVWRTSRVRRRNRRLGAGAAVAAVAAGAVVVSQWGGTGPSPEDLAPAVETTSTAPVVDQLVANERFLDGLRASGVQPNYRPLKSPTLAVSHGAGRVIVGVVSDVRPQGDDFVVTVDVQQTLPDGGELGHVDILLDSGPLHEVTPAQAVEVGGPILVVLRDQVSSEGRTDPIRPYVDGFWLEVPDGVGNPYADYADMRQAWPPVGSVEELATVLREAEVAARPEQPPPLPVECSASWQNPPFVDGAGLTPDALSTADTIFAEAGSCDEEALIARAVADGTDISIGEGDAQEQLVTPDPDGAYLALAAALTTQATVVGEHFVFAHDGWRVVIDSNGRWVEFSRH